MKAVRLSGKKGTSDSIADLTDEMYNSIDKGALYQCLLTLKLMNVLGMALHKILMGNRINVRQKFHSIFVNRLFLLTTAIVRIKNYINSFSSSV